MLAPCTMVITVMRVATPIVRPSIVKEARSLCARRALKHSARLSRMASIGEEEHSLIARVYPSSVLDGKSGARMVAVAQKGSAPRLSRSSDYSYNMLAEPNFVDQARLVPPEVRRT